MSTLNIAPDGIDVRPATQPTETPARPAAERQAAPRPQAPSAPEAPAPTVEDMREIAARMREALAAASREPFTVDFREDERSAGFVLQIRNQEGEVVRQFPPEKVLNLRSKLDDLSGVVIDEVT